MPQANATSVKIVAINTLSSAFQHEHEDDPSASLSVRCFEVFGDPADIGATLAERINEFHAKSLGQFTMISVGELPGFVITINSRMGLQEIVAELEEVVIRQIYGSDMFTMTGRTPVANLLTRRAPNAQAEKRRHWVEDIN